MLLKPAPKAFLFDFGETLFSPLPDHYEKRNLLTVKRDLGVEIGDEDFVARYRSFKRKTTKTFSSRSFFLHRDMIASALTNYLNTLGFDSVESVVEQYCRAQRLAVTDHLRPRTGCVTMLSRLRQYGLTLGIVSNIDNDWLDPLIQRFNLKDWFDLILTSETAQSCKPDRKIFDLSVNQMGVTPDQCVFVGDSEINDVLGAKQAGMRTIRFIGENPDEESVANVKVRSLAEIADLIQSLR